MQLSIAEGDFLFIVNPDGHAIGTVMAQSQEQVKTQKENSAGNGGNGGSGNGNGR